MKRDVWVTWISCHVQLGQLSLHDLQFLLSVLGVLNFGICAGNILLAATLKSSRGIQQICRFLHKMAMKNSNENQMCNCSSSLWLTLFFNKWLGSLQMVGWGNGTVIGIAVLASSSAAVNILNTGIPGTYGSIDMHYTGVVRMWDMPYRLTSVPSSMNVFFLKQQVGWRFLLNKNSYIRFI